jgi:acetyltransferase-like isoleucine patch superfamily enzyme/GT2 family glycosyltransferase
MGERVGPSSFDASILLVVRDQRQELTDCLVQIAQLTSGVSFDVVIVDDGSRDGTAELFASLGGDVQTVRHAEPKGRAACIDLAARQARGRNLVLLDTAVELVHGWLASLVRHLEMHGDLAALGLPIVNQEEQNAALGAGYASAELCAAPLLDRRKLARKELPALGAGCLLVRRAAFIKVGGLDERFRSRGADLDLLLRLHARSLGVGLGPGRLWRHAPPTFDAANDGADLALLRRRWGSAPGASPNAIWAEDMSPEATLRLALEARQPGAHARPANADDDVGLGRAGHFPNEPARRVPPWVDVGARTYFAGTTSFRTWTSEERIRIGSYCSFADDVTICTGGGHSIDTASSFPFEALVFGAPNPTRSYRTTRDTVIGSDVWVGTRVIIGGGIQVGHGAAIATGSVVLADVPPYAVVAGNPATILRRRFSRAVVDALLRIAWWDWPERVVLERLEWFFRPIGEFVARFDVQPGDAHAGIASTAQEGDGHRGGA